MNGFPRWNVDRLIRRATIVVVLGFAYLAWGVNGFNDPLWDRILAYALCGILIAFIAIALRQRQLRAATFRIALLFGCVLILVSSGAIGHGRAEVRLRLKITNIPKGQTPQVMWSTATDVRVWTDAPWNLARSDDATAEFISGSHVSVGFRDAVLYTSRIWSFAPSDAFLVVDLGGERSRLSPMRVFPPEGTGQRPPELVGTISANDLPRDDMSNGSAQHGQGFGQHQ